MDNKTLYLTVDEVQKQYLPIGKKKIRKMLVDNLNVIRNGNRILVNREELITFLGTNSSGVVQV